MVLAGPCCESLLKKLIKPRSYRAAKAALGPVSQVMRESRRPFLVKERPMATKKKLAFVKFFPLAQKLFRAHEMSDGQARSRPS